MELSQVVGIIWIRQKYGIAGIEGAEKGMEQALGRAGGNDDAFRTVFEAHGIAVPFGNGLFELRQASARGIMGVASPQSIDSSLDNMFRCVKIRLSYTETDHVFH
jgi:hypothetical protein